MNYIKRLFNQILINLNSNLTIFEKIIYFVLCTSLIIITTIFFIQSYPYWAALIAFILFITSIYLYSKNISTKNYINTKGGDFNELIQGNYIKGDYVNNINIQGNRIDLNQDITQVIAEIREILNDMVNKGYGTEEAVNRITNDFLEGMKRKPNIKSRLFGDENINDSDIIKELIDVLIDNHYFSNYNSSQMANSLEDDDYHETIYYKGYTIYLETDKDGIWHYKIEEFLYDNTGESYFKPLAIDEAKGKIDEERFRNW